MSIDFIIRLIGMVVFSVVGVFWGINIAETAIPGADGVQFNSAQYGFTLGLVGALIGLVLTPYITTRPFRGLWVLMKRLSAQALISAVVGLMFGLLFAALLAFPLSLLPKPFGEIFPFVGVVFFGYLGIALFSMRQTDFYNLFNSVRGDHNKSSGHWGEGRNILLDTSVIIDGRIADIAKTGFLPGTMLIPRFVLNELQYIADSPDNLRRQRGRRGMEVLSQLQKDNATPVKINDIDVDGVREVDDKLVVLARQMHCPILTNDYNLNRIAELQGVTILNVNELANAVKSVMLPGENLVIRVIQEGKEQNQGVGYLDDGTMVVVEYGRDYLGKEIQVTVTKILQTAAGKMIFARPDDVIENGH
jgi:uncharacterized protein YacL